MEDELSPELFHHIEKIVDQDKNISQITGGHPAFRNMPGGATLSGRQPGL